MIDNLREVETPEGVVLTLRAAGPFPRAGAYAIDLIIRLFAYLLLAMSMPMLGIFGDGVMLLCLFIGEWLYPVLFEVTRGATPGKRALGLRVTHDDGTPVRFGSSLLRNTLLAAELFPFAYLTALLTMLVHPEGRRLGDIAAGTLVVYAERPTARRRGAEVTPVPVPVRLTADEQRLLADFADRCASLPEARVTELADLASPLTGARGPEGQRRLLGMAQASVQGG